MQYWEGFMETTILVQRRTTTMTDPVFKRWDSPIFAVLTVAILATLT
jgi:hypothetical protein